MKMAEPWINVFLTYLDVKEHVGATIIYTHVLNKRGHDMRSPIDGLCAVIYSLYITTLLNR